MKKLKNLKRKLKKFKHLNQIFSHNMLSLFVLENLCLFADQIKKV